MKPQHHDAKQRIEIALRSLLDAEVRFGDIFSVLVDVLQEKQFQMNQELLSATFALHEVFNTPIPQELLTHHTIVSLAPAFSIVYKNSQGTSTSEKQWFEHYMKSFLEIPEEIGTSIMEKYPVIRKSLQYIPREK